MERMSSKKLRLVERIYGMFLEILKCWIYTYTALESNGSRLLWIPICILQVNIFKRIDSLSKSRTR